MMTSRGHEVSEIHPHGFVANLSPLDSLRLHRYLICQVSKCRQPIHVSDEVQ